MKTFRFLGNNLENKSRVSYKLWKIERKGRTVIVRWHPVMVDRKRRTVPRAKAQERRILYASEKKASEAVDKRIQEKLNKGYERVLRVSR